MSKNSQFLRVVEIPPLSFRVSKWWQRSGLRGGWRFRKIARRLGWLNVLVRYPLQANVSLDVPVAVRNYDGSDVLKYEHQMLGFVVQTASRLERPVTLIDCGADIGLISARLVASCPQIQRVIAFEPNSDSYSILAHNMKRLPAPAEAMNAAVADFSGQGELRLPEHNHSDRAAFIAKSDQGNIKVMRIDDLGLRDGNSLLLKIDVEGGELAVIRGALETLARSKGFVVVFEMHPKQVSRTGIDSTSAISLIRSVRPCNARVTEQPDADVSLEKPFFDQFAPTRVYNVCVFSD